MSLFADGAGRHTSPVGTVPSDTIIMATWMQTTVTPDTSDFFSVGVADSNTDKWTLGQMSGGAGDFFRFNLRTSPTLNLRARHSTVPSLHKTITTGVWHHLVAFNSLTYREVFSDGYPYGSDGERTDTQTDVSFDATIATFCARNGTTNDFHGYGAHCCLWAGSHLTRDHAMEVSRRLYAGENPLRIMEPDLHNHWSFETENDQKCHITGNGLTNQAGALAFSSVNPPVHRFVPNFFLDMGAVAGGGFQAAWAQAANTGAGYGRAA